MRVHLVAADQASWREWQTSSGVGKWSVYEPDPPRHGDQVVGVLTEPGSPALVMDVSTDTGWSAEVGLLPEEWEDISFPLRLSTVWDESGLGRRRPGVLLTGAEGEAFSQALDSLRSTPEKQREGRSSLKERRERSRAHRKYLLARHTGVCPSCERDFGEELTGGRGLAALQVHHLTRVAARPDVEFDTAPEDLAVVCASCHVLAGAASSSPETDIHPDLLRQVIRPGSKRRCIRCGHDGHQRSKAGLTCRSCATTWQPQLAPKR